ncbi:MAG: hypothetical protein KatS3mg118_1636 [Paracoccaceae bacterium]|nr:MAG: hypothetical protein KatS3mg118_1636 [Paracoccaceae bacterium]
MLGRTLVTEQTGPAGRTVNRVYIEEGAEIAREFYLSLLVDRTTSRIAFVVSTEGGMDIEQVAHDTPEKDRSPSASTRRPGCQASTAPRSPIALKLEEPARGEMTKLRPAVESLYRAFVEKDCQLLEINPLIADRGRRSARARRQDALRRQRALPPPRHRRAARRERGGPEGARARRSTTSNYIALDGEIGCMVNGAGLAMATMDIIKLYGGEPANFLDVGGGATKEKVTEAFKIITSDPKVKGILVNIFGGIMRCDIIAEGDRRRGAARSG